MAGGVELHALALQEVASVCGLTASVGARRGGRGACFARVVPSICGSWRYCRMGRILEAEVSRVLERPVRLIHHELASADVASAGEGVSNRSIENDVDKARALELVGWAS